MLQVQMSQSLPGSVCCSCGKNQWRRHEEIHWGTQCLIEDSNTDLFDFTAQTLDYPVQYL